MSAVGESHEDRRRSFRTDVHGCALVHGPGGAACRAVVLDLCLGGVRVLELGREVALPPGCEVIVELECAGAGWVSQRGVVVRREGGEVAIRFHALAPDVEDLIEDEVLGAVEAEKWPRAVIVDLDEARRERIAEALRGAGCCAMPVTTPLEALALIERSRNHVAAVVLADHLTQTQADDLVAFLRASHPEVCVAAARTLCDGDAIEARAVRELVERLRQRKIFK